MITPLVVATALFMENIDPRSFRTSLPAIAADLHRGPGGAEAGADGLSAFAGDVHSGEVAGRRQASAPRGILRGYSRLRPASIGVRCRRRRCRISWPPRILQGLGGAMMTPVGRLALLRSVPRSEIVRALAWLTVRR